MKSNIGSTRLIQIDHTVFICNDVQYRDDLEKIFNLPFERKLIDLRDRAKLRVKQNETNKAMYTETAWASDANATITLAKRSTQDT
ncbi:Hypothetical protein PHPALM_17553 [Phytophthora palmivora]|uniref:Uncharacterized protein n=1 Tax=Phytophthora palmivora TaxID=4796 RepID=A0A2P4XLZ7_9STRA|nr:Hypothetical protein PHPALM_17553 [Phytophthora palmivora]